MGPGSECFHFLALWFVRGACVSKQIFYFMSYFIFGVLLLYRVMLVSAVQWSESAICIHISPPSWVCLAPPFPGCILSLSQKPMNQVSFSWLSIPSNNNHNSISSTFWIAEPTPKTPRVFGLCLTLFLVSSPPVHFPCCCQLSVCKRTCNLSLPCAPFNNSYMPEKHSYQGIHDSSSFGLNSSNYSLSP